MILISYKHLTNLLADVACFCYGHITIKATNTLTLTALLAMESGYISYAMKTVADNPYCYGRLHDVAIEHLDPDKFFEN